MVALMTRSIDLLEELARESDNVFADEPAAAISSPPPTRACGLALGTRRGSVAGSARARCAAPRRDSDYRRGAAGRGLRGTADRDRSSSLDRSIIRQFAWLTEDTIALVHARRCGWSQRSAARHVHARAGARQGRALLEGRVGGVETSADGERGEGERAHGGARTHRHAACSSTPPDPSWAASPASSASSCRSSASATARWRSTTMLGAIPRAAPLTIWCDPVRLPWIRRGALRAGGPRAAGGCWKSFPAGVHGRPEGAGESQSSPADLDLRRRPGHAPFPVEFDPLFRGDHDSRHVAHGPGLAGYLSRLPRRVSSTVATTPRRARTGCCSDRSTPRRGRLRSDRGALGLRDDASTPPPTCWPTTSPGAPLPH